MRQIRIYLLLRDSAQSWHSQVYRDIDEAISTWIKFLETSGAFGLLHVGITRPLDKDLADIAPEAANCLLLTASARWAFSDFGTYSSRVGFVGNLGVHVALSGWGYGLRTIPKVFLTGGAIEVASVETPWLQNFMESHSSLADEIRAGGIHEDDSYLALEHCLTWETRRKLGLARFNRLMQGLDHENPITVASNCPPWVLDAPLSSLRMTVRCANSLRHGEVVSARQLLQMSTESLLRLPNFGRKSSRDLASSLVAAVRDGPFAAESPEYFHHEEVTESAAAKESLRSSAVPSKELQPHNDFKTVFGFRHSHLKKSHASILDMRIGRGCVPMTLEKIGENANITRERVRQIEVKVAREFARDPVWEMEFAPRLIQLLSSREDPLPVQSLDLFDPWFRGIGEMCAEFEFVVQKLLPDRFHVLEINDCKIVTELSSESWATATRHGYNIVVKSVAHNPEKSVVRRAVEELLVSKGSELVSELWAAVTREALFCSGTDGLERLMGVGTSAEAFVMATLSASDHPIHYSELPKRVHELFGRQLEVRRAHNAAGQVGLLFGRGTYGTMRHCPLTNAELVLLREEAEAVVLAGPIGRQWTCLEILMQLDGLSLDFLERVNQFSVDIALQQSTVLADLGRFIWSAANNETAGPATRIDVTQAVLSVLQSAGEPLTRAEIRDRLLEHRGLSGYFQLHPRGSLVKVSYGHWGILERDVPYSREERQTVCDRAANYFAVKQVGVHFSELSALRSDLLHEPARIDEDPHLFQSILLADPRFKSSAAGYVYLSTWEGPRRLSQGDAVVEVMLSAQGEGLHSNEIAKRASAKLGRTIDRECIYAAIAAVGGKFDELTATWSIIGDEDKEELAEAAR